MGQVRVTSRWIDDKTDFGEDRVFDKEKKFKYWHPNIFIDGQVCISILHKPGYDEHNS